MSKIIDTTIPASFVKIDDRTTAADQFANVHDHQLYRQNHNILLAQRIKRSVLDMSFNNSNTLNEGSPNIGDSPITLKDMKPGHECLAPVAMRMHVAISQVTQTLTVVITACKSALDPGSTLYPGGDDPTIYALLHREHGLARRLSTGAEFTISAANGTPTKYTATIPVEQLNPRRNAFMGFQTFVFEMLYSCVIDNTQTLDTGNTQLSENDWVDINGGGGGSAGDVILNTTNPDQPIRNVVRTEGSGANYRYFGDRPWERSPTWAGVGDAFEVREVQGIDLYSISVYENPVTGYFDTAGAL